LDHIGIIYICKKCHNEKSGYNRSIALFCTFLLGVLISYEFYLPAIAGAVIMTLLLAEKRPLHSFATNLTDDEILSAVRFLAVVFILYPITPVASYMGIINPRTILLIVIFVATISFISFVIMKQMGTKRGIPLSGMLAGLLTVKQQPAHFLRWQKKGQTLLSKLLLE